MNGVEFGGVDSPQMRRAGKELLSLALIDARNHGLRWAAGFEAPRGRLGSEPGGFVFDREKWAHELALPEFEIDAQAVSWAQYGEFVEDGGYDEARHWSPAGWAWVQAEGRRTPRYVDQMRQ